MAGHCRKKIARGVAIRPGTVLIREGIFLPGKLTLDRISWMPGWRIVKHLMSFAVSEEIQHAGWAFLFVGDPLQAIVIGGSEKTVHRARCGMLAGLKGGRFDILEATAVITRRFLGVPWVCITAYSRHIHEGVAYDLLHPPLAESVRAS